MLGLALGLDRVRVRVIANIRIGVGGYADLHIVYWSVRMSPNVYEVVVAPVTIRTEHLAPFPVVVTVSTVPASGLPTNEPTDEAHLVPPLPVCPSALDLYQAISPC